MSIWDQYPNYSPAELRGLAEVAAEVLYDEGQSDTPLPDDLLMISPRGAAQEIEQQLEAGSQAQVQRVLEDEALSQQLVLRVLEEIRQYPELAEEIDQRYAARQQKMAVPELILLSGALVVLAMRIKEINLSRKGKRITFYPSGEAVKTFVGGLIGKVTGL